MPATRRAVLFRPSGIVERCAVPVVVGNMPSHFLFFENRLYEREPLADLHDDDGRVLAYQHRSYSTPIF